MLPILADWLHLVAVSVWTVLPPARTAPALTAFHRTTRADDLSVTLDIEPGLPGINSFTATITSGGKPVADARDVSLEFTSLTGMMPPSEAATTNQGNGFYHLQGGYLPMPDQWDIKVAVIRPANFDAYADFKFDMSGSGGMTMP